MALSDGIRAGAAYIEIYTRDSRLVAGLEAAERRLKAFGSSITAVGKTLMGLGVAGITPLLATTAIFSEMGDKLAKMSVRTGISVESLSELGYAADQSGADLETLEAALRRMQKQITEADGGAEGSIETFEELGLSIEELASLSPEKQFERIADRLSEIEDPTRRAAMAMEVFGKSGTKLLPLLSDGVSGIDALREQARKLGLTISTEDAKAAEYFGDTLDDLWKTLKSTAFIIGATLAPFLIQAAKGMTRVVVVATDWVSKNRELVVWVFKIALAAVAAGVALIALGVTITGIGAAFGLVAMVITGIGSAIAMLGSLVAALLTPIGLVSVGVIALAGYLVYASGIGGQAIEALSRVFGALRADALAAFQGISDALAAGDLALAAKILWLTLKLEWQKGIHWLQETWIGFKDIFLAVWTEAVFGLSKTLTNAWAGLQSIWTESVAAMSSSWALFSSGAVSAWRGAQNVIARGIVRLMGMLDESIDVEATIQTLQDDMQREEQNRSRDTAQRLAGIETTRQERQTNIEQQRTGTLAALDEDRERTYAERNQRFGDELRASEEALTAARQEWQAALSEAATKRAESDAWSATLSQQPELDLEGLDGLLESTARNVDVVGTFNPLAAANLGSDSLNERTARASEQVAANTKRLVQEAQNGGLVFG